MKTKREKTLEFFLLLVLFLIVISFIMRSGFLLYPALAFGITGLFLNKFSGWIYAGWMKFSRFIAFVVTLVVLSLTFFIVLYPVSIIYRMIKKDPLKLRAGHYPSMFEDRSRLFTQEDLDNMW